MRIAPEIVLSGYFWLPKRSEKRLPGTITIADGGRIQLDVLGTFDEAPALLAGERSLGRIVGVVEKHGYLTLENCIYEHWNLSFGGISKCVVYAHVLFLGHAFDEGERPLIDNLAFSVEGLDEWHSLTGLQVDLHLPENRASIFYRQPQEVLLWADNGISLSLRFAWKFPALPALTKAEVTQRSYLCLRSDKSRPLEDFLSVAHKLINFLSLAIDETVSIRDVFSTTPGAASGENAEARRANRIELYFESLSFVEKPPEIKGPNMLLRYDTLKEMSQLVIGRWLTAHERVMPAMNLYFSARAGAHQYLNSRFLSLAQAVETYHRRTSDKTTFEASEFSLLKWAVVDASSPDYRDFIAARLNYGNELSFAARLREMIAPFGSYFGEDKQQKKLIRFIVDTRNYFTHYDPSLEKRAAHGRELLDLCLKLEAIFQLQLMSEIGFTSDAINAVLKNSRTLRQKLTY